MIFIILSIILWLASVVCLYRKQVLAPGLSFLALLSMSFASSGGMPLLPISPAMMWGWLAITIVVMVAVILQPINVRDDTLGAGYMLCGGITGLAVGLLGFTVSNSIRILYGIMVVAVAAGVFFGNLLYTPTPNGRPFATGSTRFTRYLLAKGFPTAITVMQMGVALVLTVALYRLLQ